MKKLGIIVAFIAGALFLGSCEGPTGPEGPGGPAIYPEVYEYKLDFNKDLNASVVSQLVKNPVKVFDGDVALVYLMTDLTQDDRPIWSPLPHRYFVTNSSTNKEEELEFNYNFSIYDIEFTASSAGKLGIFNGDGQDHPGFLKNRIFRVVYVPAQDPIQKKASADSKNDRTPLSYDEAVLKYNLQNVKVNKQY